MTNIKLCIDVGHGMSNKVPGKFDSGATSKDGLTWETREAMKWGLTLKEELLLNNINFYFTRDDETDHTPVSTRDDKAKANGCTHFLSIHFNSADSPSATGIEVFIRDNNDLAFGTCVLESLSYATKLKKRKGASPTLPAGLKYDTSGESQHSKLDVLDFVPPAALLEGGFMSNKADLEIIKSKIVRIAFAKEFVRRLLLLTSPN